MKDQAFWDYAGRLLDMAGRKTGGTFHVPAWFWDMAQRRHGAAGWSTGYLLGYRALVDRTMDPDALRYVR